MDYFYRVAFNVNETTSLTPIFGIIYKQRTVGLHVLLIERTDLKSRWFDFEMLPEIHHSGQTIISLDVLSFSDTATNMDSSHHFVGFSF